MGRNRPVKGFARIIGESKLSGFQLSGDVALYGNVGDGQLMLA
jgi:hypothetical protein